MLVKVCGMREPENIEKVAQLGVDMMGFIFYPKSSRFASQSVDRTAADKNVCRVGVFVNESAGLISYKIHQFDLNAVQLHGNESRELCELLHKQNGLLKVIKAISVSTAGDIQKYKEYVGAVDYFLFDTKCKTVGGSGQQFDWQCSIHLEWCNRAGGCRENQELPSSKVYRNRSEFEIRVEAGLKGCGEVEYIS